MARLNEAPLPTESVDSIKRRFYRQNRELAKNNSAQSQRIRALETENSHLLSENIHLREQHVHKVLEFDSEQNKRIDELVESVQHQLESKLADIAVLIAELGNVKNIRRAGTIAKEKLATDRRVPRQSIDGLETTAMIEGRLPVIREDKSYPRRTLDAEDIRRLSQESNSPDLGPPPVVHFTDADPIKFDPVAAPRWESGEGNYEMSERPDATLDQSEAPLLVNLETRKKRRDGPKLDIRRISVFNSPPTAEVDGSEDVSTTQSLKAGAKRKLSAREDNASEPGTTAASCDFTFRKPNAVNGTTGAVIPAKPAKATPEDEQVDLQVQQTATQRKVLGNKSVNASPKKRASSKLGPRTEKIETLSKQDIGIEKAKAHSRKASAELLLPPQGEAYSQPETTNIDLDAPQNVALPPKTPAAIDLFQPSSAAHSLVRTQPEVTQPPTDSQQSASESEAGQANAGRVARRARASINYAEPNLVSKMRRPTEKKVDAVTKEERRLASIEAARANEPNTVAENIGQLTAEKSGRTRLVIKQEDPTDSAWKTTAQYAMSESQSPLGKKSGSKTTSSQDDGDTEPSAPLDATEKSASSRAISALISAGRKRPVSRSISPAADEVGKVTESLAKTEIFDIVPSSSPANGEQPEKQPTRSTALRRHSSMVNSLTAMADSEQREATARSGVIRPSSRTDMTASSKNTIVPASVSHSTKPGLSTDGAVARRKVERTTSRRRSMMV